MGKKGTAAGKNTAKEGGQTSQEAKEDPSVIGNFMNDLPLLCTQRGIPEIHVIKRGESSCTPYTILVETEETDPDAVVSIYMRGWLLTENIASLFADALVSCATLAALHFWNVGFSTSTLNAVVQLSSEHHIREVTLDGNDLIVYEIVTLLKQPKLEKLSMKNCNIGDEFIQGFVDTLKENTSLLHLNLSCNQINDAGCIALATYLRLNRTLLSLILTNNHIKDDGAMTLAKTLSKFILTHEEVVLQRQQEARKILDEQSQEIHSEKARTASPHSRSPSSLATDKSKGKGEKSAGNKTKKGDMKKDEKAKKDDKAKKVMEVKKAKPVKEGKSKKSNSAEPVSESPLPESVDACVNPLLTDQLLREPDGMYLVGNMNILYLGLAYNEIGPAGAHSLLGALKEQNTYMDYGTGLLRLTLQHNIPRFQGYQIFTAPDKDILSDIEELLMERLKFLEDSKATNMVQNQPAV